ncbi:transposase [candidate division LCP-89 bacterium B3_LCP]|uniref:Transposase n=1 Tax=candidate division LCP-89 bacterium B3_LCP TaxID=2012998 RepID=A0A532V1H8_UNCL8|nr:MAG: transposase [candidate division LCP-89 bacterium B3_LCP]
MAHTFISCICHVVFATKERAPIISPALRDRLYPYFGALARDHHIGLFAVGGIEDHVHLLVSIPSTMSVSQTVKIFKGASSRWIHQEFDYMIDFAWQGGYGAFSVSRSLHTQVKSYIENQLDHHQKMTYEEEMRILLLKHEFSSQHG